MLDTTIKKYLQAALVSSLCRITINCGYIWYLYKGLTANASEYAVLKTTLLIPMLSIVMFSIYTIERLFVACHHTKNNVKLSTIYIMKFKFAI